MPVPQAQVNVSAALAGVQAGHAVGQGDGDQGWSARPTGPATSPVEPRRRLARLVGDAARSGTRRARLER